MIEIKEKDKCSGCGACYSKCIQNAIKMEKDNCGFNYPEVIVEKCNNCDLCKNICPILNKNERENNTQAYACINKDEKIREVSSSGGIFSLISKHILNLDGIIFGACFNEKFEVVHDYIENEEDLEKFRGSKYVQSYIGETYKKAKEFLNQDRYVLFTGTPCQIEGLYAYLQKDYGKLFTQDIICHGVPSPKVWDKYKSFLEEEYQSEIKKVDFRNKETGWSSYSVKIQFKNDKEYKKINSKDLYMQAFLKNISLRDSCYNCSFKKKNRISDITLADFWGIQNVNKEMFDNKGTSLVMINSQKGRILFEEVKKNIIYCEVNFEESIRYNTSMTNSVNIPNRRKDFFQNLQDFKFDTLVKKYLPKENILKKCAINFKNTIIKIVLKYKNQ